MNPKSVIHLAMAESKNDILDIFSQIEKEQKEQMQAAQQAQQEQVMTQMQMDQQRRQEEQQFLMAMEKMKLDQKDQASQREMHKFQIANDVNQDGKADLVESKLLEIDQRAAEHEDKMELARQKQSETTVRANI